MHKCIIVEDEDNSRDLLVRLIMRYCPNLKIVGTAAQVDEAKWLIENLKPDLLFLDIEIGGGTGFDVISNITHKRMGIIFTTGYDQFAIKAIKSSAIDYLLKPIDFEELIDAVTKFENFISSKNETSEKSNPININKENNLSSLIIPSSKGFTVHATSDIVGLCSEGSYSKIILKNEKILASKPIGYFEEILPENQFMRIHYQTIININLIKAYLKGKGGTVIMQDGSHFEVSERRKDKLLKRLQK
jgi:two-component system LytT family response regulator